MGGWKWSQRGLSHTSRIFRGRGNLFLNAVCVQSHCPTPSPHSAVVTGDIVKGNEANCFNQGSVLILSPCWSFAFGECDFASSTFLRTKPPKSASHWDAHLFFTCPSCTYGQRITISRGLLRNPAAGSAQSRHQGGASQWDRVERCPLCHTQHTSRLQ